jgi:hypothetical protein
MLAYTQNLEFNVGCFINPTCPVYETYLTIFRSRANSLVIRSKPACKMLAYDQNRIGLLQYIKETVSRDFRPLVFFINQLHLGP